MLLDRVMKSMDAPSHGWAVTFFVTLCLIVIGSSVFIVWVFRRNKEGKPLCSATVKIVTTLFLVTLVALGSYLSIHYFAGAFLKHQIENFDVAFLGEELTLGHVVVDPFHGLVTMDSLEISNPPGWNSPYLLRADTLYIDINMGALILSFFRRFEVHIAKLSGVRANYEQGLTTSNVVNIINHLNRNRNLNPHVDGIVDKGVVLHEVSVTDCWAKGTLFLTGNHGISVAVPDIHYEDFDKEVGARKVETIIAIILSAICTNIWNVVTTR